MPSWHVDTLVKLHRATAQRTPPSGPSGRVSAFVKLHICEITTRVLPTGTRAVCLLAVRTAQGIHTPAFHFALPRRAAPLIHTQAFGMEMLLGATPELLPAATAEINVVSLFCPHTRLYSFRIIFLEVSCWEDV